MKKYLVLLVALSGCNCDTFEPLRKVPVCQANPDAPGCQPPIIDSGTPPPVDAGQPPPVDAGHPPPVDAGHPPPVDAGMTCGTGTVTGQICAPDTTTFVSGATVTVSGTCDGVPFTDTATTDNMGNFTFTVPAGTWTLTATSGSFMQTFTITVTAGETTTESGDMQFCFAPTVPLAVITGSGDQIENLLTATGFTPTLYDGTTTGWGNPSTSSPPGALQFLKDPAQLAKYKVIFIDCAAGRTEEKYPDGGTSYSKFFFESDAAAIASNLKTFVQNGGSLYGSDWAFIFIYLVAAQQFQWDSFLGTTTQGSIAYPFDPYELEGYPNQNITGNIVDANLAAYMGSNTVPITFPSDMSHWGLLSSVNGPATELITGSVEGCTTDSCDHATAAATVPLAAIYQTTAGPGGVIAYTSFHNIDQTDPAAIETILKYIVFKL